MSQGKAGQNSIVRYHDIIWLIISDIALFRWLFYIVAIKQEQLLALFYGCFYESSQSFKRELSPMAYSSLDFACLIYGSA